MQGAVPFIKKTYTFHECITLEEKTGLRYEYFGGEIFAMAGGTTIHNEIVQNISTAMRHHFRPKGCKVFAENVKLEAIKDIYYPYPDVIVTCDELDLKEIKVVKSPVILVEVLSTSSIFYDKNVKLKKYQNIASLIYYLLVSQYERSVELYSRTAEKDIWTYQLFEDPSDIITFEKLGYSLTFQSIYDSIEFVEPEED